MTPSCTGLNRFGILDELRTRYSWIQTWVLKALRSSTITESVVQTEGKLV